MTGNENIELIEFERLERMHHNDLARTLGISAKTAERLQYLIRHELVQRGASYGGEAHSMQDRGD